jgi:hypothetical protein
VGTCVNVTDAGAGQADVTIGQKWVIASHSGAFNELAGQSNLVYWIGDADCGWDSCTLNIPQNLSKERTDPIAAVYSNALIVSPYYIYNGDNIEICGTAYCGIADSSNTFGVALGAASCAAIAQNGEDFPELLASSTNSFTNAGVCCFSLDWTAGATYEPCDTLFELGFHALGLNVDAQVKFTYSFKLTRGCTS